MSKHPGTLLFGVMLTGCQGVISSSQSNPIEEGVFESPTPVEITATTHSVQRLTHTQWLDAVHYTLQLPESTELPDFDIKNFPSDKEDNFLFGEDPQALEVTPALFSTYRSRAEAIAEYILSSPANTSAVLGSESITEASVASAMDRLGRRAYRRPLSSTEKEAFLSLYETGVNNPKEGWSAEQTGFSLVIRTLFESPQFLYLTIPSGSVNQPVALDAHTLATRLSYFLWDQAPDEELREAADSGSLINPEILDKQTQRLMNDPRFESVMVDFHDIALGGLGAFSVQAPELYESAKGERSHFIRHAIATDLSWSGILTAPYTFANSTLAEIYGIQGSFTEDTFKKVDLSPEERKGALTHVAFLGGIPNRPVPRGVWLSRMIACNVLGSAVNADPTPPDEPGEGRRALWEAYTEAEGSNCVGCHKTKINPFGFVLETYDERGQYRSSYGADYDNVPIDTQVDEILLDGSTANRANNAPDLISLLANAEKTHECYARHLTSFALGRPETKLDNGLIQNVKSLSSDGTSIKELIRFIIQSKSFRSHQPDPENEES